MKSFLSVYCGIIEHGCLYATDLSTGILVTMQLSTGEFSVKRYLKWEDITGMLWLKQVKRYQNELLWCLRNSKAIIRYNMENDERVVYRYDDKDSNININSVLCCSDLAVYDKKIVLVPYDITEGMVVFDLDTMEFTKMHSIKNAIEEYGNHVEGGRIFQCVTVGEYVYFSASDATEIWCMHLADLTISNRFSVDSKLSHVCGNDGTVFAIGDNYYYELASDGKFASKCHVNEKHGGAYRKLWCVVSFGQFRYLVFVNGGFIIKCNCIGETINRIDYPEDFKVIFEIRLSDRDFTSYCVKGNILCLLPFSGNGVLMLNMETDTITFHQYIISPGDMIRCELQNGGPVHEGKLLSLEDYISVL